MYFLSYRRNFWDGVLVAEHDAIRDVELDGSGTEDEVSDDDFTADITGKRLLVLIHGYHNSRDDVVNGYAMIDRELRNKDILGSGPRGYTDLIGVTWPGGLFRISYTLAKLRANAIADSVFARLKKVVAAANAVDIMTHSLGARVALKALQNAPAGEQVLRNLFLTAPAVDNESIQQGEKFFAATQACRDVYVLHSKNDTVLKRAFPIPLFGDSDQALGLKGPEDAEEIGDNVHLVDCAVPVKAHSDYRKRLELYSFIKKVINGQQTPAELPDDEGCVPGANCG
jgi:esterase/lipase superfamily enzyme